MKRASLALFSFSLVAGFFHCRAESLIPAGSLIPCTVSEPKLSSKTLAVGDPVLCKIGYMQPYDRSSLPYDSYMVGRFEDYRDPGHLVGKGWMELKFERMVIEPDTVIPVETKVVAVPGYPIDRQGRIHGKGHPVRDTIAWTLPILWPIDILNLPRRGPRPTLKGETRLTLKVMDDLRIPDTEDPNRDPSGLLRRPSAYEPPRGRRRQWRNDTSRASAPMLVPTPGFEIENLADAVPPALPADYFVASPAESMPSRGDPVPVLHRRMPYPGRNAGRPRDPVTLVYNDGRPSEQVYNYVLTRNTLYVLDRGRREIPVDALDMAATERVNRDAGVDFAGLARAR
jgi:hypothetical protein